MYERYHACNSCINRSVVLHTVNGDVHQGIIVGVDTENVYLDTSGGATISAQKPATKRAATKKAKTSAFGFGFGGRQAITTLALFDLLAIVLIL